MSLNPISSSSIIGLGDQTSDITSGLVWKSTAWQLVNYATVSGFVVDPSLISVSC